MKYLKFLVFILISLSFGDQQNGKEFNFENLKSAQIVKKEIGFPNETQIYNDQLFFASEVNSEQNRLITVNLTKEHTIVHHCYSNLLNDLTSNEESIELNGKKLNIYELLHKNTTKKNIPRNIQIVFNNGIYSFDVGNKKYILLGASDRQIIRNIERNYWLLLEVKGKEITNTYSFIDGYTNDANCFNDFNNDNILDYLNWDFNKNKIDFYTLEKNDFTKNEKYYIYVNPSPEQTERKSNGYGVLYNLLDQKKSKWFYKLNK